MRIKRFIEIIQKRGNITVILLTLLIIEIVAVGYFYWQLQNLDHKQVSSAGQDERVIVATPPPQWQISLPDTSTMSAGWMSYEDKVEGFKFKYPLSEFTLKADSLEELDKRESGNKPFSQSLYELKNVTPPKVVKALRFDNGDYSGEFYFIPFSLWIFDNPDGLTTDQWYEKYSYFPMLVFTAAGQLTDGMITIDGQLTKYNYHRFAFDTYNLYLSKGKKMYLLHIEQNSEQTDLGFQILSTFEFLDKNLSGNTRNWKTYSGTNSRAQLGFPQKYTFSYPSEWELDESKSTSELVIQVSNQKVGVLLIDPGGHGGGSPLRTIRAETVGYPAGPVEITELLYPNNRVRGTFSFMGTPNNAPLQPMFGFEFDYSYTYYDDLKQTMDQILKSVSIAG